MIIGAGCAGVGAFHQLVNSGIESCARLPSGGSVKAGLMSSDPFAPIPFHRFRGLGMQMVAAWWRRRENLSAHGAALYRKA